MDVSDRVKDQIYFYFEKQKINDDLLITNDSSILYLIFLSDILSSFLEFRNSNPTISSGNELLQDLLDFIGKYITSQEYKSSPNYEVFKNFSSSVNTVQSNLGTQFPDSKIEIIGDYRETGVKTRVGDKIFYPNNLKTETFIESLVKIIPEFSKFFPSHSKRNVNGIEFIERDFIEFDNEITNFSEYFYNWGMVISFVLYFQISDLIQSNFLISNNTPILFDLEFIGYPKFNKSKKHFGLLDSGVISKKHESNISALLAYFYNYKTASEPRLFISKNELSIKWIRDIEYSKRSIKHPKNINSQFPLFYLGDIYKGMIDGKNLLIKNQNKILELLKNSNFNSKFMFRPSTTYSFCIKSLFYNLDSSTIKEDFKKLLNEFEIFRCESEADKQKVIEYETSQLMNLHIPYFYINLMSTSVLDGKGNVLMHLEKSPYELILDQINSYPKIIEKEMVVLSKTFSKLYTRLSR